MKKILLFILLFSSLGIKFTAQVTFNNTLPQWLNNADNVIRPEYPGGQEAFMKYVTRKLSKFQPNKSFSILVSFVVEKDGSLNDVAMVRGTGLDFDNEVIKIIRRSRRWKPGTIDGEPARITLALPIRFNIEVKG